MADRILITDGNVNSVNPAVVQAQGVYASGVVLPNGDIPQLFIVRNVPEATACAIAILKALGKPFNIYCDRIAGENEGNFVYCELLK